MACENSPFVRRQVRNGVFHGNDDGIRRRSSGRDADDVIGAKPFLAQIVGRLHVMHARAKTGAGFDQFMRVVAVRAADDDDHVAFLREFDGRVLPLFRRLADGVNETHFGLWKTLANQLHELPDLFNRLRGLGHHAEPRPFAEIGHVLLVQHHVKFIQIVRSCRALPRGRACR